MQVNSLRWCFGFLGSAGFILAGCDSATPPSAPQGDHAHDHHGHGHGHAHDDHDHAHVESYAAGVGKLTELHLKFREALDRDDKDAADEPVHEFGHVLEEIVPLAEKAGLSSDSLDEVKQAVEHLFEDVGKVDEKIHGKAGAAYSEVAERVEAELETLKKHVPTP